MAEELGNIKVTFSADDSQLKAKLASSEAEVKASAAKMGAAAVVPIGSKAGAAQHFAGRSGAAAATDVAAGAAIGATSFGKAAEGAGVDAAAAAGGGLTALRGALRSITAPFRLVAQLYVLIRVASEVIKAVDRATDSAGQFANVMDSVGGVNLNATEASRDALNKAKADIGKLQLDLKTFNDAGRNLSPFALWERLVHGRTYAATKAALEVKQTETAAINAKINKEELKAIKEVLMQIRDDQAKATDRLLSGFAAVPSRLAPILELRARTVRR
jgi:hypothetical protein